MNWTGATIPKEKGIYLLSLFTTEKKRFVCRYMATLHSVERWFLEIESGAKTVEGRLSIPGLIIGDTITFIWKHKSVVKKIKYVHEYSCFAELLDVEGLQKVLPGVSDTTEGCAIFKDWYSNELQRKKGVIAIGLE